MAVAERVSVKMLTHIAGHAADLNRSLHSGEIVDVKAEVATAWIKDGMAAPVRQADLERAVRA